MTRRNRITRAFTKPNNNYVWAVILGEGITVPVDTAPLILDLVADADWTAIAGQKTATVMAIRGWMSFVSIGVAFSAGKWYCGTQDEDIITGAGISPATVGTYVDEDIMWTGGWDKPAVVTDTGLMHHEVIDIKAKRKIQTATEVRMVLGASATNQIAVSVVLRTLLKLNSG